MVHDLCIHEHTSCYYFGVGKHTIIPAATRVALLREEIRNAIPVAKYIQLLHEALATGRIPNIDPHTGKPLGTWSEIPTRDRIDIAKYLINKALPDRPEPAAQAVTGRDLLSMTSEQVKSLSSLQLAQIIQEEIPVEVIKPEETQP